MLILDSQLFVFYLTFYIDILYNFCETRYMLYSASRTYTRFFLGFYNNLHAYIVRNT